MSLHFATQLAGETSISVRLSELLVGNTCAPSSGLRPSSSCATSSGQPSRVRGGNQQTDRGTGRCWSSCASCSALHRWLSTASTSVSALSRTIRRRFVDSCDRTRRSISIRIGDLLVESQKRARSAVKSARSGRFSKEMLQTPLGQAQAKRSTTSRASAVLPCPPPPWMATIRGRSSPVSTWPSWRRSSIRLEILPRLVGGQ